MVGCRVPGVTALASGACPQLGARSAHGSASGVERLQRVDRPPDFDDRAFFVAARAQPQHPATVQNLEGFRPICRTI